MTRAVTNSIIIWVNRYLGLCTHVISGEQRIQGFYDGGMLFCFSKKAKAFPSPPNPISVAF